MTQALFSLHHQSDPSFSHEVMLVNGYRTSIHASIPGKAGSNKSKPSKPVNIHLKPNTSNIGKESSKIPYSISATSQPSDIHTQKEPSLITFDKTNSPNYFCFFAGLAVTFLLGTPSPLLSTFFATPLFFVFFTSSTALPLPSSSSSSSS